MVQSTLKTEDITYSMVMDVANRYQIEKSQMRNILGISESTQFRYEKKNPILSSNISDRWIRSAKIIEIAADLFEDETETKHWLSTPKRVLENKTPLELLDTNLGCQQVEQVLMQASYGVFS